MQELVNMGYISQRELDRGLADRVGLLYDIAQAIFSTGLDIRWAKALTTGGVAHDSFHVVGADGQAPTDAGVLGHAANRSRRSVSGTPGLTPNEANHQQRRRL